MFRSDQLGPALRFLRSRRQLKQLQVAARAGITSSMLSGYENGRKTPTLVTLEKILQAMDFGLADLLDAIEGERGSALGRPSSETLEPAAPLRYCPPGKQGDEAWAFDLEAILGSSPPLATEEVAAFGEMLSGYCRWLRYLRHQTAPSSRSLEDV